MMNIQERQQLTQFLEQLTQAQAGPIDSEADALIRGTCARQPQAVYLLVQRAMILEQALQNSQNDITRLQGQLEQARYQPLAGDNSASGLDANAWGNSAAPRPAAYAPAYAPAQATSPAPIAAPAASAWGSGMLGSIAGTAAGVVGGALLFQGIGSLLGNHAAKPAAIDSLSSPSPTKDNSTVSNNAAPDDNAGSADIFDLSSVDDYIASDSDGNV
jgi:hypothetical protein